MVPQELELPAFSHQEKEKAEVLGQQEEGLVSLQEFPQFSDSFSDHLTGEPGAGTAMGGDWAKPHFHKDSLVVYLLALFKPKPEVSEDRLAVPLYLFFFSLWLRRIAFYLSSYLSSCLEVRWLSLAWWERLLGLRFRP